MSLSLLLCAMLLLGCQEADQESVQLPQSTSIIVLGVAQDAGYPQIGCTKKCCKRAWEHYTQRRFPTSLAVVDPESQSYWIIDATPDIKDQLDFIEKRLPESYTLRGVFLTHAHIGHYTGLMHFGREAMGAKALPVYAMPRMSQFLSSNGPWSQLVKLKNIQLMPLAADSAIVINTRLSITPFMVPHRDEFSETVGFDIRGPGKSALFIPDIDKWELWERDINRLIEQTDLAFLDGTFYDNDELPGRDMSEIPHPFIVESMERFATLPDTIKGRIAFIHTNHSNPVLDPQSIQRSAVESRGFRVANQYDIHAL